MKIILSTVLALFLLGCSDNNNQNSELKKEVQTEVKPQVQEKKVEPKVEHSLKKVVEVPPVAVEVVDEKIAVVKEALPQSTTTSSIDAQKLFQACSACHGAHAEKSALNKSKVIQGWSQEKILAALHGYKDGTYGGAMKGIMKGQALKLDDAQMKALAQYISKL